MLGLCERPGTSLVTVQLQHSGPSIVLGTPGEARPIDIKQTDRTSQRH